MIKNSLVILCFLFFGCNVDNAPDCIQSSGEIIQQEIFVEPFDKITVFERTQLIVSQGPFSVVLETGENLANEVDIFVSDGRLIIENNNSCNLVRDYGITKVFVTVPNLVEIRNSSGLTVTSDTTLNYQNLTLLSEDLEEEDAFHTNGDFQLNLNVENLTITQNGLSNFFLSGTVENLDLNFLLGDARFEGRNLSVTNADVFHRGTNDIIINPQESLTGQMLSTGDMIVTNTPPILDVDVLWTGQLIIEN